MRNTVCKNFYYYVFDSISPLSVYILHYKDSNRMQFQQFNGGLARTLHFPEIGYILVATTNVYVQYLTVLRK